MFSTSVLFTVRFIRSIVTNVRFVRLGLLSSVCTSTLILSVFSYGAKSVDIYSVQELVVNQSDKVRKEAASRGLETVFVRLAGSKAVLQAPAVQGAIAKASVYVLEFGYQQTNRSITIAGARKPASLLVMRFAQLPLEEVLKNNQLPIWLSNRPDILVWGALNPGQKSYMDANSIMAKSLQRSAVKRGLPITSPVLDLNDRSSLSVSRLWALDEGSILEASKRYDTDAILAGRFSKVGRQWNGNMLLLHQGTIHYFSANGTSQNSVATSIIDQAADHLASIYTVAPNLSGEARFVTLQINNVSDFNYYASVITYLESLPLLKSLNVVNVREGHLVLKASLNSSVERLINGLKLDEKLIFVETQALEPLPRDGLVTGIDNPKLATQTVAGSSASVIHEFTWQE